MKELKYYMHLYLGASVISNNGVRLQLASDNLQRAINERWTLTLRPLSNLTEEECNEYNMISGTVFSLNRLTDQMMTEAHLCKYLLSKHFDLFGLIESGSAIDKTKI